MNTEPKLRWYRSALSMSAGLLLIGICLFFMACSIAMCLSNDLTASPVAAAFLFFMSTWVLVLQYRLLFCCPPMTSRHIFGWLLFFSFNIFYILFIELGCFRSFEELRRSLVHPVTLGMFFGGSVLAILDIAARRERKRRQEFVEAHSDHDDWYFTDISPLFERYKSREITGIILLAIFLVTMTTFSVLKMPPKSGEHFTFEQMPLKGLPPDGTDFSFKYPNRGRFACEFTITEEGFRRWISEHTRYRDCEEVTDMPLPGHRLLDTSIIIDGLLAVPNGKSHNGACFDRKTQRAYYWLWFTPQ